MLDASLVTFTCETDSSLLTWSYDSSYQIYYATSSMVNDTGQLGNFTVRLTMIGFGNMLTSTATINISSLVNVNNVSIACGDGMTIEEASLINGMCYYFAIFEEFRTELFF